MSDWRKRNARALLRDFQRNGLATDVRLANYAGEDLRGEVFAPGENLAGADFRAADLSDARLTGVCLADADLTQARLAGAHLERADLSGANLSGACLDRASLIGADLTGADVTGASWRRTKLTATRIRPGEILDGWGAASPLELPRLQLGAARAQAAALAWHPGAELLATADSDGAVRIWDPAAGTTLATLTGHTDRVNAVAYAPDGTRLATAGDDGAVRITSIPSAMNRRTRWTWLRRPRRTHPVGKALGTELCGTAATLAYSPNGQQIATGHESGCVAVTTTSHDASQPDVYLIGLPDDGWAAIYGERRYRLNGDPAGRFWWTAGLCRFEPGELDGYGVERLQ